MKGAKVASRYAQSLLDLAIEKGSVDAVNQDMVDLSTTCKESKDLSNLLRSPIIDSGKKKEIFAQLFGGSMNEMSMGFINLIIKNSREGILPEIADAYTMLYKEHKGILDVKVVSAVPLEAAVREKIVGKIKESFDGTIELVEEVDSSLVGGFVVRIGDRMIDTSIASQIKNLNNILLN